MKLLHVVGNRPQFIKLAFLLKELSKHREFENIVVHSGQHYDYNLSDVFFKDLSLAEPAYNLNIGSGTHGEQLSKILLGLEPILLGEIPRLVLVYGDTNTTLGGALTSAKLDFPVGHVEAGLRQRTFSPENVNRYLTDHCSALLFCPTFYAVQNLMDEGFSDEFVVNTGDITYDAFLYSREQCRKLAWMLKHLNLEKEKYIVVTAHRPNTVDYKKNLRNLVEAIILLALDNTIFFPVHPRTLKNLKKFHLYGELLVHSENLILSNPISYELFLTVLLHSKLVITDSGGVFKEALYAEKPVVNLESDFPYQEIFASKRSALSGSDKNKILSLVETYMDYKPKPIGIHFGDGFAANKIVNMIKNWCEK